MAGEQKVEVLFVCLGNICRSPTAHGVFQKLCEDAGLGQWIGVDSAGTAAYHIGKQPDLRSVKAAASRGYMLNHLRARQVSDLDFQRFDYVLAMDKENLSDLQQRCPVEHSHKVKLFLNYGSLGEEHVPDPYYGGQDGFGHVLDLVEDAAQGLLQYVVKAHRLGGVGSML